MPWIFEQIVKVSRNAPIFIINCTDFAPISTFLCMFEQLLDCDLALVILLHRHILGYPLGLLFSSEFRHSVFDHLWLLQRSERMVVQTKFVAVKHSDPHALTNCNSDVCVQSYAYLNQPSSSSFRLLCGCTHCTSVQPKTHF